MSPLIYFTADDAGCYADSAYGHQHVRNRLAEILAAVLMRRAIKTDETTEILAALKGEMLDDAREEEDAALDLLNEHTAEPAFWEFNDGDLILNAPEEE